MTDCEILELAAKSVNLNIKDYFVDVDDKNPALIVGKKGTREKIIWSPLADDGDALRLAVKLGVKVSNVKKHNLVIASFEDYISINTCTEHYEDDEMSATRRAIVRAAAEIGAMQ